MYGSPALGMIESFHGLGRNACDFIGDAIDALSGKVAEASNFDREQKRERQRFRGLSINHGNRLYNRKIVMTQAIGCPWSLECTKPLPQNKKTC